MYVWLHSLLCEKYCTLLHAHNVPLGTVLLPLSTFLKYKQQYVRSEAPTRHLHIYTAIIARWSHPTSNFHTGTTQDPPLHLSSLHISNSSHISSCCLLSAMDYLVGGAVLRSLGALDCSSCSAHRSSHSWHLESSAGDGSPCVVRQYCYGLCAHQPCSSNMFFSLTSVAILFISRGKYPWASSTPCIASCPTINCCSSGPPSAQYAIITPTRRASRGMSVAR